jgi:hypothetical protein
VVAQIGAQLELAGRRVLSEREVIARERIEGRHFLSARPDGDRHHRPDLVLVNDRPEALEVELTDKSNRRLDTVLRAWLRAVSYEQFALVRYLCSPRALPYVARALKRLGRPASIYVEPLRSEDGRLVLAPTSDLLQRKERGSAASQTADTQASVTGFGPHSVAPAA